MTYSQAVQELFERHQSVQNAGFSSGAYKPGLDAMRRFDAALGSPSTSLKCIHVAGTNGKGSVCSMLAAALSSSGYSVGLYTSPHLLDFRERMKIIGPGSCEMVSEAEVMAFLEKYESALDELSFFEVTTGMAFRLFADREVDWAVVETGLGGRLDSTNIISPEISVITSIGLDHCAILGSTREAIAGEKAGIFKSGVPAVVVCRDAETAGVFTRAAAGKGSPLTFAGDLPPFEGEESLYAALDLQGPGQRQNLHTALTALELLGERSGAAARGLRHFGAATCLRGRWETLRNSPTVICDIGHNPPALAENFARLESMRGSGPARRPLFIVYGVMRDKDLGSILHLFPDDAQYVFCAPSTPRALPAAELCCAVVSARPELSCRTVEKVPDALAFALNAASSSENAIIYVGGSTFVVSEALSIQE